MNWGNGWCVNGINYFANPSGYYAGVTSGSNVVFNGSGAPLTLTKADGGVFTLVQAQITAAWHDNLQVQIEGFNGSTSSGIQTVTLSATAPSLVSFTKASNVDRVVLTSSGGTQHAGYSSTGTQFAMDDLRFTLNIAHNIEVTPSANGTMSCTPNPVVDGSNALCTAVPNDGFTVTNFSGCTRVGSSNDCELTNVTEPKTVVVTFAAITYPFTILPSPNGTVSCTPNPVAHGGTATCDFLPVPGGTFSSGTLTGQASLGVCTPLGSGYSCQLTNVMSPITISASFQVSSHGITVAPLTNGSMSCTPNPVSNGGTATCTAVPDFGFAVVNFSGCARVASTNNCELTNVTAPATVAATFAAITYPISITPSDNGTMSCTPNPVAHGDNATCTAVPASGFAVASFSGCMRVGSTNDCELANATAAATVSATFTALPVITTTGNLPDATEGQPYSQSLVVTGGTAPYTWAVVDGSLPPGMTLDTATGVISGTVPKQAIQKAASLAKATGAFSFGVQVTDSSNPQLQSTVQQLSLQVVAAPVAATATPVPTLGTWALAVLSLFIAGFGLQRRSKMQG